MRPAAVPLVALILGCAGLPARTTADPFPVFDTAGGTEVTVRDPRTGLPGPDDKPLLPNGEQRVSPTRLEKCVEKALADVPSPPREIEITVESYRLEVVKPGKSVGAWKPLANPFDVSTRPQPTNVVEIVMMAVAWPVVELGRLGYFAAANTVEEARGEPGVHCRIRATAVLTWPGGRRTATLEGRGDDDNVAAGFWGDAIRGATDRALDEFADQLRAAAQARPPGK